LIKCKKYLILCKKKKLVFKKSSLADVDPSKRQFAKKKERMSRISKILMKSSKDIKELN